MTVVCVREFDACPGGTGSIGECVAVCRPVGEAAGAVIGREGGAATDATSTSGGRPRTD